MLVRVSAKHFVAGIVLKDDVCVHAAPILNWAKGKQRKWLSNYFKSKGWKVEIVSNN